MAACDHDALVSPKFSSHLTPLSIRRPGDRVLPLVPVPELRLQDLPPLTRCLESVCLEIGVHHDGYQFAEGDPGGPFEFLSRFRGVSQQALNLEWSEVTRADLHVLAPVETDISKNFFDEFPNRVGFTGANHKIVRPVLLQHEPHCFHVLGGISPVPFRFQVSEEDFLLLAGEDSTQAARDLARNERFTASGALVVEEDTV